MDRFPFSMRGYIRTTKLFVVVVLAISAWFVPTRTHPADTAPQSVVKVGVADNRPIVFRDTNGHAAGIAIDILEPLAKTEGWKLEYVFAPWSKLLEKLENGEVDLAAGIGYSEERGNRFRFTQESVVGNWGVIYKAPDIQVLSPLDLKERRVALMTNAIHTEAFIELMQQFKVSYTPIYTDSYEEVLSAVASGMAEAGVVNRIFGALNAHLYKIDITSIIFNPVYVHYAGHKSTTNGLISVLDQHIKRLKADPNSIYYRSLDRWLTDLKSTTPLWITWGIGVLVLVLLASLATAWMFRYQVKHRTSELAKRSDELMEEIEQHRLAQERLNQIAFFDSLTGIPNRASFFDRFPQVMSDADLHEAKSAVMSIDIDRLKTVNDSLGHAAGDILIRVATERLRSCLRANDNIYRFGGDEFIITVGQIRNVSDVDIVAHRLLSSLKEPIEIGNQVIYASISIGIALYPDNERSMEGLLKNADAAMHHAKDQGRNRYQLYRRDHTERVVERLDTETRLRKALEQNELLLHYQPILGINGDDHLGLEALIRWNDPQRGMIPPNAFIPHAEESGAIVPLGAWVLEQACTQVRTWQNQGMKRVSVSVNVSTRQFEDNALIQAVDRALEKSGLDPHLLELEITEGVLLVVNVNVGDVLHTLKRMGVRLAIDDFGTGYSSLAYLKQLPIDVLKIDRSFVSGIPVNSDDCQIASTIITMAHGLGLRVVAEGIETEQQLRFLQEHGCDMGQGYYFAKPMAIDQMLMWSGHQANGAIKRTQR